MKRVFDKKIDEEIFLKDCGKGDTIHIPYDEHTKKGGITCIVVRIKTHFKPGLVQMKYRQSHRDTVQKIDILGNTIVRRTRNATAADGPNAGYVPPERFYRDDILYQRDVVTRDAPHMEILDPLPKKEPVSEMFEHRARPSDLGLDALFTVGIGSFLVGADFSSIPDINVIDHFKP